MKNCLIQNVKVQFFTFFFLNLSREYWKNKFSMMKEKKMYMYIIITRDYDFSCLLSKR